MYYFAQHFKLQKDISPPKGGRTKGRLLGLRAAVIDCLPDLVPELEEDRVGWLEGFHREDLLYYFAMVDESDVPHLEIWVVGCEQALLNHLKGLLPHFNLVLAKQGTEQVSSGVVGSKDPHMAPAC